MADNRYFDLQEWRAGSKVQADLTIIKAAQIPFFDGKGSLNAWLSNLEQFFQDNQTEEENKEWIAVYHLAGYANEWYTVMLESWGLQGWPGFVKYLQLEFGSTMDASARGLRDTLIQLLSPAVPSAPASAAPSAAAPSLTTVAVPDPGRCIFSTGGLTNNTSTGVGPHDTATSTSGLDIPGHDDRDITPFIYIRGSVSHDDIAIFTTNSSKDGRGCS